MRRLVAGLTLALLLGGLVTPAFTSGQCGPIRYYFYENSNYGGHGYAYCGNLPDLSQATWGFWPWENFDNKISSLKVVTAHLTVYDGYNYAGFLGTYYQNTPYVGDSYNDRFSSLSNGFNP